ncbi:MAG: PilZ domain-containing protein [Candidatus Omnitrophica bacterium]|nr:PilZ domain-containing protein [Candidatus Omnitrophota bacterium]
MIDTAIARDRRFFLRIGVRLPLIYLKKKSNNAFTGQINDISANGIGLISKQKISCKTALNLIIHIPHDGPFCAEGEVAWIKKIRFHKYRIGIFLKKVDLVGVSRILTLAKTLPEPPPEEAAPPRQSLFPWFKKPGLAFP